MPGPRRSGALDDVGRDVSEEHFAEVIQFPGAKASHEQLREAIRELEQQHAPRPEAAEATVTALPGTSGDAGLLQDAEDALVRSLARSPKSVAEAQEMLQRDYEELGESDRHQIIGRMLELEYLDDARLAAQLRDGRFARKQLSRNAMERELRARGIDAGTIDEVLAPIDGDDEFERALELARDRARRTRSLDYETAYRRIHGYLARRGFGGEVVSRAIREALNEGE